MLAQKDPQEDTFPQTEIIRNIDRYIQMLL